MSVVRIGVRSLGKQQHASYSPVMRTQIDRTSNPYKKGQSRIIGVMRLTNARRPSSRKTMVAFAVSLLLLTTALFAFALSGTGRTGAPKSAWEFDVNLPPVASAECTSAPVISIADSSGFASTSFDPDGTVVDYFWDFGDGTHVNGTAAAAHNVTHTYLFGGSYLVNHAVTDNNGAKANDEATMLRVYVIYFDPQLVWIWDNSTAPYAVLFSDKDIVQNNTLVNFNMTGCYGIGGWEWINVSNPAEGEQWFMGTEYITSMILDFGDGTVPVNVSTSSMLASHMYVGPGHYAAKLNVTANNSGHAVSTTVMRTVHVLSAPIGGSDVKNPNAFIEATIGEPSTLDPASCYEYSGGEIIQNVYETLVWFEGSSPVNLVPMIANEVPSLANGLISSDGMNCTFNIRPNVMFHDGTTVTADDVVYSIQRVLRMRDPVGAYFMLEMPLNDYMASYFFGATVSEYLDASYNVSWIRNLLVPKGYSHVIDDTDIKNVAEAVVQKVNDTAVRFRLTHPCPAFLTIMANTVASVVSKTFVEAHGGITPGSGNTYMTTHMMGTGPYYLDVWEVGSTIHLVRWDSYWGTKAKLKDVYVIQANDVITRMLMLQSGDADYIYLPIRYESSFAGKPEYRIIKGLPEFIQTMLTFNFNIDATKANSQYGTNVTTDFFHDVHMRRAFSHIFNFSQYIANVARNNALQPNGAIPAGMFGYDPSVPRQEYSLAMAELELRLAINPATGNSWWNDGFNIPLSFNFGNLARQTACEMLKQSLEALAPGRMTATIIGLDWPSYATEVFYNSNSFAAMYVIGWAPDYSDPDNVVTPELHSWYGIYPLFTGYENLTINAMIEEAGRELDSTARARMYSDIGNAVYNDTPYIWLTQSCNFHIERSWMNGYVFNPILSTMMYYPWLSKTNSQPMASFEVLPAVGDPTTVFTFDAWGSADADDQKSVLEVRWDWDNDGSWDTNWSTEKVTTHQFATEGLHYVILEVKDTGGLTDTDVGLVTVEPLIPEFESVLVPIIIIVAIVAGSRMIDGRRARRG